MLIFQCTEIISATTLYTPVSLIVPPFLRTSTFDQHKQVCRQTERHPIPICNINATKISCNPLYQKWALIKPITGQHKRTQYKCAHTLKQQSTPLMKCINQPLYAWMCVCVCKTQRRRLSKFAARTREFAWRNVTLCHWRPFAAILYRRTEQTTSINEREQHTCISRSHNLIISASIPGTPFLCRAKSQLFAFTEQSCDDWQGMVVPGNYI